MLIFLLLILLGATAARAQDPAGCNKASESLSPQKPSPDPVKPDLKIGDLQLPDYLNAYPHTRDAVAYGEKISGYPEALRKLIRLRLGELLEYHKFYEQKFMAEFERVMTQSSSTKEQDAALAKTQLHSSAHHFYNEILATLDGLYDRNTIEEFLGKAKNLPPPPTSPR